MVRNWIQNIANSPGIRGLFASFVALASLTLMAYAVWAIWQTLGPASESIPADVRVLDGEPIAAASDQDDPVWTALDDVTIVDDLPKLGADGQDDGVANAPPASAPLGSSATRGVFMIAAAHVPSTPTAPATVTPTATSQPRFAATSTSDAGSAATITDASVFNSFVWEEDAADSDLVEVVDVSADALRATEANQPFRLVIPSIRVDSPVINVSLVTTVRRGQLVSTWQVARNAVGFHSTSALPGTLGNTVMSGHNNAWGRVFRDLIRIKHGDEIEVHTKDRVLRYKVEDKLLVQQVGTTVAQRHRNATWIGPTDDERLTLVSCWPYRRPTHRLIVVARPIHAVSQDSTLP